MAKTHSQNASGGVAGGDGKLECLCGKAGASCVCDGSRQNTRLNTMMQQRCV